MSSSNTPADLGKNLQSQPKARWQFRIAAAMVALISVSSLLLGISGLSGGHYGNVVTIALGLMFFIEFGAIALRGDGCLHLQGETLWEELAS